mmetsp:Transcript_135794/g.235016  ORF Transcript_135794/g.235016 Transcript_135794/m.235016 type:complete len:394 (+) Transcript_135794:82-1263(+)
MSPEALHESIQEEQCAAQSAQQSQGSKQPMEVKLSRDSPSPNKSGAGSWRQCAVCDDVAYEGTKYCFTCCAKWRGWRGDSKPMRSFEGVAAAARKLNSKTKGNAVESKCQDCGKIIPAGEMWDQVAQDGGKYCHECWSSWPSRCIKWAREQQDVIRDEFLAKHGIEGAAGNKLAKMKHGDFKKISQDFHDPALGAFADRRALFDSGAQAQRLEAVYDIDWSQLPAASSAKQKQNQAAPKKEFAEEKKASPQQEPAAENTFKEATPNKELTEEKVASQEQEPTAEDLQRKELEKAQNLAKNALEEAERQLRECELRQPREKPSSQHSSMNKVAAGSSSDTAKEAEDQVKSEWEQEQNEYIKIEKEYWYDCEEEMVVVPQVLLRKTSKSSGCRQM